jgi:hypothetical protein
MSFFKKLFCNHAYPEVVFTTNCYETVECSKCGKKKTVEQHSYKEIKRFFKTESYGSLLGSTEVFHFIKVVYECQNCHEITSKDFRI